MKNWTPGRIAFEAHAEAAGGITTTGTIPHWYSLNSIAREAWETAANAVLADRDKRFVAERETRWRPTEVPSVEPMPDPADTGLAPVEQAPEPATPIETAPDDGR